MKVGILIANVTPFADAEGAAELAHAAEKYGFESLWTAEHVLWPTDGGSNYPYGETDKLVGDPRTVLPDPLVWLTWVAAHSTTLRLATGILILPQRNPAVLAKELATLDQLSGGRVDLGIGIGWCKEEFEALGVPFEARGARNDEYVEVMRRLWTQDDVGYSGRFVEFAGMNSNPKPVNSTIPIIVGGHTRRAAERAARLGDGFFPAGGDIRELIDMTKQLAADAGRDPSEIEMTAMHPGLKTDDPAAVLQELESWGVDRVTIRSWRLGRGSAEERCARWADAIGVPAA